MSLSNERALGPIKAMSDTKGFFDIVTLLLEKADTRPYNFKKYNLKQCIFLFDFGHSSIRKLIGLICEYCSIYILENMHCSHFMLLQIYVNGFMRLKLDCCRTGALRGPDSAL